MCCLTHHAAASTVTPQNKPPLATAARIGFELRDKELDFIDLIWNSMTQWGAQKPEIMG